MFGLFVAHPRYEAERGQFVYISNLLQSVAFRAVVCEPLPAQTTHAHRGNESDNQLKVGDGLKYVGLWTGFVDYFAPGSNLHSSEVG